MHVWHLSPPWFRGHHILNMFFVDPHVQIIPIDMKFCKTLKHNIFLTLNSWSFLARHVLVGVNSCGRCVVVALLPQIAKLREISQNNGFKICELIWVGKVPLYWMKVSFCHLEMIWVEVQSKNQPQFKFWIKTTIDIPIIISYITKPQHLNFGLWVVTPNLQTSIRLDWSKMLYTYKPWEMWCVTHLLMMFQYRFADTTQPSKSKYDQYKMENKKSAQITPTDLKWTRLPMKGKQTTSH